MTLGPIVLGCAAFSLDYADDRARAEAAFIAALDAGITTFDTAHAYSPPGQLAHNERLVADILTRLGRRDATAVMTKGGHFRRGANFVTDNRPEVLRAHCEQSLRALRTDRIDLYFVHHVSGSVPVADAAATLEELRSEGKIARIGVSNVTVDDLIEAGTAATIDAVQNPHSAFAPGDQDVIDLCLREEIYFFAYSPLRGRNADTSRVRTVAQNAAQAGISPARWALAWLLRQGVRPVIGAKTPAHIVDAAAAHATTVTAEALDFRDGR